MSNVFDATGKQIFNTNEIKLTKEDAKNAKEKINNFFFNYFEKAIVNQMEINGGSFILGDFPYWEDDSKLDNSIGKSLHFNIQNIKGTDGSISGFIHYDPDLFNCVLDTYKIPLMFEFYGDSGDDCDFLNINSTKDLKKIKKFSIAYFNFYEHSQILLSEELMSNFENLLFLRTLRG